MKKQAKDLRKGDRVLIKNSVNGASEANGKVVTVQGNVGSGNFNAMVDGVLKGFFSTAPADDFVILDGFGDKKERELVADALKDSIKYLKEEIAEHEEEIYILENFDSEEEYTAHKLTKVFEALGSDKSAKEKEKAVTEVLRTMRESNFI